MSTLLRCRMPILFADGHTLVVPRKHVSSIYELTADEQSAIWSLVAEMRRLQMNERPTWLDLVIAHHQDRLMLQTDTAL
jgi:diadenosine tetraphosphate (Ap4A) HIT family hydrolase